MMRKKSPIGTKTRKTPLFSILLVISFLILIGLFFLFVNPEEAKFFPKCPFYAITGYQCPGCGSSRAVYSIMHGNWKQAWQLNPALFIGVVLIILLLLAQFLRSRYTIWWRIDRFFRSEWFIWGLFVSIVLWWIFRNIH